MTNDTEETILDECTEEKDLGVWTSNNKKPPLQCLNAAATAMFVLKSTKRSFHYLDKESFNIMIRLKSGVPTLLKIYNNSKKYRGDPLSWYQASNTCHMKSNFKD